MSSNALHTRFLSPFQFRVLCNVFVTAMQLLGGSRGGLDPPQQLCATSRGGYPRGGSQVKIEVTLCSERDSAYLHGCVCLSHAICAYAHYDSNGLEPALNLSMSSNALHTQLVARFDFRFFVTFL